MLLSLGALLIGVLAPYARPVMWRVPTRVFSFGMFGRASLLAGLSTLALGWVFGFFLSPALSVSLAAAIVLSIAFAEAHREREQRGLALLAWRITQRDDDAIALATTRLKGLRAQPEIHASAVCFLCVALSAIDEWDRALEQLESIDLDALEEGSRLLERVQQARASAWIQHGEIDKAAAIIAAIARPASEAVEPWLAAFETLLLAIRGEADRALEEAARVQASGALHYTYEIARAHAWAKRGERERARDALKGVLKATGEEGLARAISPEGPASALARDISSR